MMKINAIFLGLTMVVSPISYAACVNDNCDEHANRIQHNTEVRVLSELVNEQELRQNCELDNSQNTKFEGDHPRFKHIDKKLTANGQKKGNKFVEVVLNENSSACEIVTVQLLE